MSKRPPAQRRSADFGLATVRRAAIGVVLGCAMAAVAGGAEPTVAETLLERGDYLVNGIANCGNCHSPHHQDGTLSGPALSGGDAIFGEGFTAYPPNITPDRGTGLGGWTEDQIVVALREGRTPSGASLRPPMPVPFYRAMSDRDAHAIAVYLRSLAPVEHTVPLSHYDQPPPRGGGLSVGVVSDPDRTNRVAYGAYLARIGHCMLCHTPRDTGGRPDIVHRNGAGGVVLRGRFGIVVAPNITPDVTSGIGGWTDRQIKDALTLGMRPDGTLLAPPMPWRYFATMRDQDLDAVVAYLRTLPPIPGTP